MLEGLVKSVTLTRIPKHILSETYVWRGSLWRQMVKTFFES